VALEAAALEVELVDHQLVEQPDDVGAGADRVALVGERALERAGAAQPLPALEHQDLLARLGQVGRRGQAVVAAAHHDGVPVRLRQFLARSRQPAPPEPRRDLVHLRTSSSASASTATAPCAWTITGLSSISTKSVSVSATASRAAAATSRP